MATVFLRIVYRCHGQIDAVVDRCGGQHVDLARLVHAERAVPPVEQLDPGERVDGCDHALLVILVAAVDHHGATQNRPAHVEAVKCPDVASRLADGGAEVAEGAGDVVQLTVEGDGKGGGGESAHRKKKANCCTTQPKGACRNTLPQRRR